MKTHGGDVGVSLALANRSTQTCRIKMFNACRLCRVSNGELIKLVVKRSLDATDYKGLDTLLNSNLLWKAELYMHNIPWKFGGKQCIEKESFKI